MMLSPESFIMQYEDLSYKELIKIRNNLINDIRRFERNMSKEHDEKEPDVIIITDPSPEVVYQVNLKYLGKLCELISEKYNQEYIWREHK